MAITHRTHGNVVEFLIEERIDRATAGQMREYILAQLEGLTAPNAVLNFGKVEFVDSVGLGLILSICKTIEDRGGHFGIIHAHSKAREVLTITKSSSFLYDDINAFKATV